MVPRIYGGVEIDDNEKAALTLPPKFTTYERIDKQKCLVEIETMVSKYMWELRKTESEDGKVNSEDVNTVTARGPKFRGAKNDRPLARND